MHRNSVTCGNCLHYGKYNDDLHLKKPCDECVCIIREPNPGCKKIDVALGPIQIIACILRNYTPIRGPDEHGGQNMLEIIESLMC